MSTKFQLLPLLLLWCLCSCAHADDSVPDQRIAQLIARLNSNRFGIRQQAYSRLLKLGEPVLKKLNHATDAMSAEQRHRVERLIHDIRLAALKQSFAKIFHVKDSEIDLDEGMILIAKILEPTVDRAAIEQQLDDLAAAVRQRLGVGVVPKHAAPADVVEALIAVLRDDFKLSGNVIDYDNPNNSSLKRVFATRQGLPIIISHVAVSVAERLDVPIVGLAIPRRYMIKYDGARAPLGHPNMDIIVDPFGDWEILNEAQVKELIPSFDAKIHLVPSARRESLTRMLRNLSSDLIGAGDPEAAALAKQVLDSLESRR